MKKIIGWILILSSLTISIGLFFYERNSFDRSLFQAIETNEIQKNYENFINKAKKNSLLVKDNNGNRIDSYVLGVDYLKTFEGEIIFSVLDERVKYPEGVKGITNQYKNRIVPVGKKEVMVSFFNTVQTIVNIDTNEITSLISFSMDPHLTYNDKLLFPSIETEYELNDNGEIEVDYVLEFSIGIVRNKIEDTIVFPAQIN